jgi:hypothetical protein
MTEVLEHVITAETLRMAIRAKLRIPVSRRTISLLIQAYAPTAIPGRDDGTDVRRLPVEAIPDGQRVAFLGALDQLQDDLSNIATTAVRLKSG